MKLKKLFSLSASAFFIFSLSTSQAAIKASQKTEPTFGEIAKVAIKSFNVVEYEDYERKIKRAPWLPTLSVGYDKTLHRTSSISINDNIQINTSGVIVGPQEEDSDLSHYSNDVLRFRALWNLDELVFHPSSLSLIRDKRSWMQEKQAFIDGLFKITLERNSLYSEIYTQSSSPKRALLKTKYQSLTEKLDFMTNGLFRDRWRSIK